MDYTIKAGDNLTNIAKANKTDVATLAKLNNISNTNLIKAGTTLKLPGQQTQTVTPLTATPPTTPNVSATSIGQVNPISLPSTPAPVTPTPVPSASQGYLDSLALSKDEQTAKDYQTGGVSDLIKSITGLQGETAYKAEQLKLAGVKDLQNQQREINNKYLQIEAEKNKSDTELVANMRAEENRDTLLPFAQAGQAKLAGDAAIIRALKTSEQGMLNAKSLALTGNIEDARATAQEAVDLKYAPYKEQIKTYNDIVEALKPILTSAEKKQADAQQFKGNVALKQIDALSKFQSDAIANALSNNAPQSVLNKINSATSISDITAVGGNYLVSKADKLDQQLKQAQIANQYASIAKTKPETGATGKPATDAQIKNAGFATRIEQSNKIIDANPKLLSEIGYKDYLLIQSNNPLANTFLSPEKRKAALAMTNFITAKLRPESGAAISPSEFTDARKIYFPTMGDDEATLASKKELRDGVLSNLIVGSGSAYTKNNLDSYLDTVTQVTSGGNSINDYLNSLPK